MAGPFPATVVADPEAQLNFEALGLLLPQGKQQILQAGTAAGGDLTGTYPNPTISTQGANRFLQLLSTQKLQLAFGQATLTWPGASTNTGQVVVSHGLTGVPQAILATPVLSSSSNFWWPVLLNITTTQLTLWGTTGTGGPQPAASSTGFCYWLAIG